MESWFLADTEAMRSWTGNKDFFEPYPEDTDGMPWDRLKEIGREIDREPGKSKVIFARKFIRKYEFHVRRAGNHPRCPSARYFMERLWGLSTSHPWFGKATKHVSASHQG